MKLYPFTGAGKQGGYILGVGRGVTGSKENLERLLQLYAHERPLSLLYKSSEKLVVRHRMDSLWCPCSAAALTHEGVLKQCHCGIRRVVWMGKEYKIYRVSQFKCLHQQCSVHLLDCAAEFATSHLLDFLILWSEALGTYSPTRFHLSDPWEPPRGGVFHFCVWVF